METFGRVAFRQYEDCTVSSRRGLGRGVGVAVSAISDKGDVAQASRCFQHSPGDLANRQYEIRIAILVEGASYRVGMLKNDCMLVAHAQHVGRHGAGRVPDAAFPRMTFIQCDHCRWVNAAANVEQLGMQVQVDQCWMREGVVSSFTSHGRTTERSRLSP